MYRTDELGSLTIHNAAAQAPASAPARDWRTIGRAVRREPLTHFLLFGILIFIVAHVIEARSKRYTIEVGEGDIARIVNSYQQQYGSPPSPDQVHTMVDNYIREEIYLREGLALGLDRNDEIVRRRVAQKYDFVQQDMATPREPTEAELAQWFAANQARFALPEKRSYEHVYFAIDQRGDTAARDLASAALAGLRGGEQVAGDAFPGPQLVRNLSEADSGRLFGGTDFARLVFTAAPGTWYGPVRSGFGWHLVRVSEVEPGRQRSLAEAHDDVRAAWIEADRLARNGRRYAALQGRYTISRADRP